MSKSEIQEVLDHYGVLFTEAIADKLLEIIKQEKCDKCDYFISVEEAYKQGRIDVIEECKKLVEDDCTTYCTKGFKCVECLCEQMEQLKENNNE